VRNRELLVIAGAALALTLQTARPSRAQGQVEPIVELVRLQPLVDSTGYTGTVLVYDLRSDEHSAVNATGAPRRLIPASTFKILNSLIALELGVVDSAGTVIPWDSVPRERTELNRDLDLATAFRLSAVPHFQALARAIGPVRMAEWVERVGYGNGDVAGGVDTFWLTGDLAISPLEQIEFLVRLYRNELPFSTRTMETVKRIMLVDRRPEYTIRAKTGWGILPDGHVGWWVGWVQKGADAYFFATVLETEEPDDAFARARERITRQVLRGMGIIE
jgi:beta-lactamase class D